jgi:hypothetical protein
LVVGGASLCLGIALGISAILHATEISAYHHAGPCPANARSPADCLRTVDGSVSAVTGNSEVENADYELDVRTASTTLHLGFSSASPLLDYVQDGDPAVVTMWRGVPVAVVADGRSDVTTAIPEKALAGNLTGSQSAGGMGFSFVVGGLAFGRKRSADHNPLNRPVLAAVIFTLVLGGVAVTISGGILDSQPSRLGHDLADTVAGLLIALAFSACVGSLIKQARG